MSLRDIKAESLAEKRRQLESNPCFAEQTQSLKCIEIHSKDSDKCFREFENVKICKTFWHHIQRFRKQNGIHPQLPDIDERIRMKDIYLKTGSVKPIIDDMKQEFNL